MDFDSKRKAYAEEFSLLILNAFYVMIEKMLANAEYSRSHFGNATTLEVNELISVRTFVERLMRELG